jgi:hypothetical protein
MRLLAHPSISDYSPMSLDPLIPPAKAASRCTANNEPTELRHNTGARPKGGRAAIVHRGNPSTATAVGDSTQVRVDDAASANSAAPKVHAVEVVKTPVMGARLCPQIIEILLQYFLVPRPGFRVAKTGIKGYTTKDIRAAFHILRLERWLDARVVTDADGKRYSGWMVTLTELGQAIAEAIARARASADAAGSNDLVTPVPVAQHTLADKPIRSRATYRRQMPADTTR